MGTGGDEGWGGPGSNSEEESVSQNCHLSPQFCKAKWSLGSKSRGRQSRERNRSVYLLGVAMVTTKCLALALRLCFLLFWIVSV